MDRQGPRCVSARPMSTSRPIRLKIASPCKVSWDSMKGDDAVRFCGTCKKDVYNLSAMTTDQTEALLASPSGRPCVRFFQRADGTVMTNDCPVGAQRVRRQRIAVGVGAGLLSALGYAATPTGAESELFTSPPAETPTIRVPITIQPPQPPIEMK